MGRMQAGEMAIHANLDVALRWHLTSNHYPPLPPELLEPCKTAIKLAGHGGWDLDVELPAGLEYRGRNTVRVDEIVESCHLEAFID